jgi:hypothetical protein
MACYSLNNEEKIWRTVLKAFALPVSAIYSASSVDEKYRFWCQLLLLAVDLAFDLSLFPFFYCFNSTWQRSLSVDWRPIGFEWVNLSIRFLEKRINWNDPISGQSHTTREMFQSILKK